jgi:phage-related minor tail protein
MGAAASLGTLTVGVGLDASQYTTALTKIEQDAKRFADSQDRISKGIDRQVLLLQKQATQIGLTTREIKLQELAAKGASDAQVKAADAALTALERASASARKHGQDVDVASKAMHGFGFETAGAKRELLVLAHELSQGNYKRFGGSLLVLGEQTGAASLLFSGFGLAALGVVAALGLFGIAAVKGAHESEAFRDSLRLTGNYAGLTEGSFNSLAKSVAASSGATIGSAREITQALVSTGEFGPRVIGLAADAAAKYSRATGDSADSVVKDFAKMTDGVAKWASEHNKQLNYLTLAQYSYIKSLEEQGKVEQAEIENLKALSEHLGGPMVQNLGYLERSLHAVASAWHTFWDAALDIGRAETVEDRIAKLNAQIQSAHSNPVDIPGATGPGGQKLAPGPNDVGPLLDRRTTALREQLRSFEHAQDKAETDRVNKAGIDAKDYLDKLDLEVKGVRAVTKELDIYHQKLAAFRAAGGVRSATDVAADEAGIRRKFQGPGASDAEAVLKKQLEGQLKAINDFAGEQKAAFDFANQLLKGAYSDGLISLHDYYAAEASIRDSALQAQLAVFDKRIAAERDYLAKAKKPQDQEDARNKIAAALRERGDAATDAGRKEVLAAQESSRALEQLARSYVDLQATVLDLGGDKRGAAGLRIAQQVRDAQKKLSQVGADPALAGQLEHQLSGQADLADAQEKYNRLLERARNAEEDIQLAAQKAGTSENDTLRAVGAARADSLKQLSEMVDRANELALALGTPDAIRFAEQLGLAFKKATAEMDPLLLKIKDVGAQAASAIAGGLADAALEGKGFIETLHDLDKALSRIAVNELFTKPFQQWLGNSLGGNGQAGGANGGGGLIGAAGTWLAGLFAGGKAIGGPTQPYSMVPIAENRPEVVGDGSRQWLITGRRSYSVDPNPVLGTGGRTLVMTNHFAIYGAADQRTQNQIAAKAARSVANASARNN